MLEGEQSHVLAVSQSTQLEGPLTDTLHMEREMKSTLLHKLSAAALIYATLVGAVFAQTGGVCGGGLYCEELRQECLAAGKSKVLCDLQYRHCVQDACGAR